MPSLSMFDGPSIREIIGIRKSGVRGEYKGRVQVFNKQHTGNLSLQLSDITEKDDALYRCKINGSSFKDIRLHVKGCTLSGPERSEITASLGQSVILPCSCTETQAKPHSFTWTVGSMLTISEIWSSLGSNWSHVYRHRVQLSSNSPGDLSLLLSNFTHRDEGLYACKITTHNTTDHRLLFLTELKKGQGYSRRFPYSHIALIVFFTLPLTAGCYAWRTLKKKLCEDTAHQQHM